MIKKEEQAHLYLEKFFPNIELDDAKLKAQLHDKTIVIDPDKILSYLQSALFDEKVIEMHLNNSKETYFAKLCDFPPQVSNEEAEKDVYMFGDYLKSYQQVISLPVEPGMGNLNLRRSSQVIVRLYTSDKTIELGTYFDSIVTKEQVPMLSLSFPLIARVLKEDREFRARVPETFSLCLRVASGKKWKTFETTLKDICPTGIGFIVPREYVNTFCVDDKVLGTLLVGDEKIVNVSGKIKHVTRMRTHNGREYICGLSLRFSTIVSSLKVEQLVGQVQREHMREIIGKSNDCGVHLII